MHEQKDQKKSEETPKSQMTPEETEEFMDQALDSFPEEEKPRFVWENIDPGLQRTKVYGGWLVNSSGNENSICFVPDPHWNWKIPKPKSWADMSKDD